ncbi:hypothetical protein Lal_00039260, partial [Lupinus albus]
ASHILPRRESQEILGADTRPLAWARPSRSSENYLSLIENQYKTLPSEDDWEMANEICLKLKLFYNTTLIFSGSLYPTANVLFPKICEIKLTFLDWLQSTNLVIHQMAEAMYAKFEKYWDDIGVLMAFGVILDNRYKLCFLEFFYPIIYGQ